MADRYGVVSFKVDGEEISIVGDVTITPPAFNDANAGEPEPDEPLPGDEWKTA